MLIFVRFCCVNFVRPLEGDEGCNWKPSTAMPHDIRPHPTGNQRYHPQVGAKDAIDFSDLIYALWRGKWLIAFTTLVTILAGGYYAFVVVTPVYQSSSVVILEPKTDKIVAFQSVSRGLSGDTPEVNSELEILRARSLMHDVVKHLKLYNDTEFSRSLTPPSAKVVLKSKIKQRLGWMAPPQKLSADNFARRTRDSVISALLQKVRIENLRQSTVFRITVQTKSAAKSALIADTIAEIYIQKQVGRKIDTAAKATVWLDQRVGELLVKLEQAETKTSDFSASTALVSPESLQALKRQIKALRERIISAKQAKVITAMNSQALRNAGDIGTKIAAANDSQLTQFGQDTALRLVFDNRFEAIKARTNSDLVQASRQLEALQLSETELGLQIAKQGRDLILLQQLNREAHATRVLYAHFLSRLKETASQQGIQKADSRILSPAVIPYKPSEPRKSLILSMAAILGLATSFCLVLIRELTRTSFRSLSGLEKYLGIVGLARLPVLPVKIKAEFLDQLAAHPTHKFSNAIRGLRTSLLLCPTDNPKVIAVTSALHNEGSSATALALAYGFVGLQMKVLLIDANQTTDGLDDFFGDEPTRGITSILRGEYEMDQSLHHPKNLGADVLFADDKSVSASDLFLSEKFADFLSNMNERYDFIIINASAVTTTPSARAVLKLADTVLLNVKWDSTTKHQTNTALRTLDHVGISISGVILSDIETVRLQPQTALGKWVAAMVFPKHEATLL